jgi:cell division protein FtsX
MVGMADEELVTLLKEIRDLQKVQIANNQEAVKAQVERLKNGQKRVAIMLAIFLLVLALIVYLPSILGH